MCLHPQFFLLFVNSHLSEEKNSNEANKPCCDNNPNDMVLFHFELVLMNYSPPQQTL